jgi:hypothetical protein
MPITPLKLARNSTSAVATHQQLAGSVPRSRSASAHFLAPASHRTSSRTASADPRPAQRLVHLRAQLRRRSSVRKQTSAPRRCNSLVSVTAVHALTRYIGDAERQRGRRTQGKDVEIVPAHLRRRLPRACNLKTLQLRYRRPGKSRAWIARAFSSSAFLRAARRVSAVSGQSEIRAALVLLPLHFA